MEYRPLADFVELSQGLAVNKGTAHLFSDIKNCEFPYPLLRIVDFEAGIHDNYTKYVSKDISPSVIIDEDTIVFTRVTCQCFRGFKGVLHNNLFVVNLINDEITKDYLFTVLQSEFVRKQALYFAQSSVVPDLNHKMFKEIRIPVPNKSTQERISELYLNITNKIENNAKINHELETMARTIYDYWFLQFDFPNENGKPYKSSGGKMVWNEELKKEIPDGWRIGTLNQYIDRDKGGDWGKEKEEGNYIRKVSCLRGADFPSITGTATLTAPKRFILEKNIDKFLESGDLIIEISGGSPTQSTGRICYINDSLLERFDIDVITSNFCKAISLKNIAYMYWFYVQWKKIYESNILFKYEGKTTGIKNLLFDIFIKDYKFVQPPDELIFKYNEKVADIFEKIQKNQKESQELASLRDFLLPLLMNGQVGFKEC